MTSNVLFHNADLVDVRVEQARLLKANAKRSAIIVFFIVANTSAILMVLGTVTPTLIWLFCASLMIAITVVYARRHGFANITRDNVQDYLRGHTLISAATGLVWSGFAVLAVDLTSETSIFIFTFLLVSITLGGLLPGSIYRPGYIAIATTICVPFGLFLIFSSSFFVQLIGLGFQVYFATAMLASAQNEVHIREGITARLNKDATEQISRKNVEIQELMDAKSHFVASLSHDLSQPLIAQRNFIAQLDKTRLTGEQRSLLEKIIAAQYNQEHLLQDLVDMNVAGTTLDPKMRRVNLADVLDHTLLEFEGLARVRNITFTQSIALQTVDTDPQLLSRIVRNIMSNAIKFTPEGGTVSIKSYHENHRTGLRIRDSGAGIQANKLSKVFDAYVQLEQETETPNQSEQTRNSFGLGLSIVKKLSDLLEIDVNLTSSLGVGTTVELLFPTSKSTTQGNPPPDPARLILLMAKPSDFRVLSLLETLSLKGHRTLHATSIVEAIDLLAQIESSLDLIVTTEFGRDRQSIEDSITAIREEVNEDTRAVVIVGAGSPDLNLEIETVSLCRAVDLKTLQNEVDQALSLVSAAPEALPSK
jgi:signal transduction histidine kinase